MRGIDLWKDEHHSDILIILMAIALQCTRISSLSRLPRAVNRTPICKRLVDPLPRFRSAGLPVWDSDRRRDILPHFSFCLQLQTTTTATVIHYSFFTRSFTIAKPHALSVLFCGIHSFPASSTPPTPSTSPRRRPAEAFID